MKILVIYHAASMSDASATFRELAALPDIKLVVATAKRIAVNRAYDPSGYLSLDAEETKDGYTRTPISLIDPSDPTRGWERAGLRATIKRVEPDVIHVLDEAFSVSLAQVSDISRETRTPLLFYAFENMPLSCGVRSRIRYWKCWRNVTGGAAANTEAFKRLWHVGFPRNKALVHIPWGIDTQIYKRHAGTTRRESNSTSMFVVGFVGRLAYEKGVLVILDALRALPSNVHAHFVGTGPLEREIQQFALSGDLAGRLQLYPATPSIEMPERYASMDCLAIPSLPTEHWKEQFGRVIPEAMACGVPVIGSSSGAIPEVIGQAGVVVPEGDSGALAAAISAIIDNPEEADRLVERGLAAVRDKYSSRAMANRLNELYRAHFNPK